MYVLDVPCGGPAWYSAFASHRKATYEELSFLFNQQKEGTKGQQFESQ